MYASTWASGTVSMTWLLFACLDAHGSLVSKGANRGETIISEEWKLKNLAQRFWWLRGLVAALTLTTLVPTFMDLDRFEFLRAVHAAILGWNAVMSWAGKMIGKLPFIPELSIAAMHTIAIMVSAVVPASAAVVIANMRWVKGGRRPRGYFLVKKIHRICLGKTVSDKLDELSESLARSFFWNAIVFSSTNLIYALLYYSIFSSYYHLDEFSLQIFSVGESDFWLYFSMVALTSLLLVAAIELDQFRKGLIVFVTFLLTLEILYVLNTPWLSDQINLLACQQIMSGPNC